MVRCSLRGSLPLLLGCFVAVAQPASAQSLSSFEGVPREELLVRSWDSPSTTEKVAIRHYLALEHPSTIEGLFSRAYLLSQDGRDAEAIRVYREALALNADHLYTLSNLARLAPADEKLELLERLLRLDPAFNRYEGLRLLYFSYRDDLRDGPRALAALTEWEARLPGLWIFDFIRGLEAESKQEWQAAEAHYLAAAEKGADSFEVYERLGNLRLEHLSTEQTPDRFSLLQPVIEYLERSDRADRRYEPLFYLAGRLRQVFSSRFEAFDFYRTAFDTYPTGEAAAGAYTALLGLDLPELVDFLESANARLPDNPLLLRELAHAVHRLRDDGAAAERYFQRSLEVGYTDAIRSETARRFGDYFEDKLDYDASERIYRQYLGRNGDPQELLVALHSNRLWAGDFRASLKYLEDYETALAAASSTINYAWFRSQRDALDRYLSAEDARAEFWAENPFLNYWQAIFGPELAATLEFGPGSAELSTDAEAVLARVARMLQENGAEHYVFSIEGHADANEPEPVALSEARARAVMRRLYDGHGVLLSRMIPDAHGAALPRAAPGQAEGSANRRVAILPLGDLTQPAVSVTSTLEAGPLAISPDGRYLATGTQPVQLWDARRGFRLRDIGTGAYRRFSPNGRYLAASSNYGEVDGSRTYSLFVRDVKTGLVVLQYASGWEIRGFDWSPSSDEIALTNASGQLVVLDLGAGRPTRTVRMSGSAIGAEVLWSGDGRHIITGQAQKEELLVWRAADLARERSLPGVDWPHALAQTRDGRFLVAADNQRMLTVWEMDWTQADWVPRHLPIPALAGDMVVHPSEPRVLINDFGGEGNHPLVLVDVETMEVIAETRSSRTVTAAFSPDGRRVYQTGVDRLIITDAETLREVGDIEGTAVRAERGSADQARGYFLSNDSEGIHVWDVRSGKRVHSWPDSARLLGPLPGDSGVFLATRGVSGPERGTEVLLYRTTDFSSTTLVRLDLRVDRFDALGGRIAFGGILADSSDFETGVIAVYDRAAGDVVRRLEIPIRTAYLQFDRVYDGGFNALGFSPDGNEAIVATYWQDGFGHGNTMSSQARIVSLESGQVLRNFAMGSEVRFTRFHGGRADRVEVATSYNTFVYDRGNGTLVDRLGHSALESRIDLADGHVLWSGNGIRIERQGKVITRPSERRLEAVSIFPERRLIVALDESNEIGFWDLDGARQLGIVSKREGEWIAYTPSGNFVASILGTDKVFWSLGDRILPFDALKSKFERPGVVAERLEAIARGGAVAATPAAPVFEAGAFAQPYTVRVGMEGDLTTAVDTLDVEFTIERSHAELPAPELVFRHQGVTLDTVDTRAVILEETPNSIRYRRGFALADGFNLIDIDYVHGAVSHRGATLRVLRRPVAGEAGRARLWFLGIGASQYANESYNLNYADKDVMEVARLLEAQSGQLYEQVHTRLLLNERATNDSIRVALHEFLGQATSHDVIAIYLAGHGVLSVDQSVYFVSYTGDMTRPYTGFDIREFHRFLQNRPPTQKALFFMDICHAGGYDIGARGFVTSEDAVRVLIEGTGLVVLAASTGRQFSLEGEQYRGGHGAFTAAVLDALEGAGDQPPGDGFVNVGELMVFVERRVREMTLGQQHPTIPLVERLRDFPVVKVISTSGGGR